MPVRQAVATAACLFASADCSAISLAINGLAPNEAAQISIERSQMTPTGFEIDLVTESVVPEIVTSAQVVFFANPTVGSSGSLSVVAGNGSSVFGLPLSPVPTGDPALQGFQGGSIFGIPVSNSSSTQLASFELAPSEAAAGSFQLFVTGFDSSSPLVSSQWISTSLGPPAVVSTNPFDNSLDTSEPLLLAVVTVSEVPEPCAAGISCLAFASLVLTPRCRPTASLRDAG